MRVRYVIEHDTEPGMLTLGLVDSEGEYVMGGPTGHYTDVEAAKVDAAKDESDLTWNPAPEAWQPDAVLVSNYWNDEGWDNRG